jgi:hypothetical protein
MSEKFLGRVAKHFSNEIAFVTPNGQLLSTKPAEALAKWKRLPASDRKRLDDLGMFDATLLPKPPPDGLIVNVFARGFQRDAAGRLQHYRTRVTRSLEAGRDHLWLTEAEWHSLLSGTRKVGETYEAPEPIVVRICTRYLMDLIGGGGLGYLRRGDEVLAKQLRITVEDVSPAGCRLRLKGSARLAGTKEKPEPDDYQMQGVLTYDAKKRVITRFDLVAFCETGHHDRENKKIMPLGIAFELAETELASDTFWPFRYSDKYFTGQDP